MFRYLIILLTFSINLLKAQEAVDIIIPCVNRDVILLERCITYARKNIVNARRIIVVSPEKYTNSCEWFCEDLFPFSKDDVGKELIRPTSQMNHYRRGWYFQQLLKFYAPFVIPDISENVFVLDADTLFLKPYQPLTDEGDTLFYVTSFGQTFPSYLNHAQNLVHGLDTSYSVNPASNYMLFQKDKLQHLFDIVEEHHKKPFWKAFCNLVRRGSFNVGASEFTIYFFFLKQYYPDNCLWKIPKKDNRAENLAQLDYFLKNDYDSVSFHYYLRRGPWKTYEANKNLW